MTKTILLYSGGLDSTVLLYDLLKQGHAVTALTVDYGQRHRREIEAAAGICAERGVEHVVVELPAVLFAGSALTGGGEVPHGHYAAPTMAATVVPARNLVLLSLGMALAISRRCDSVAYAAHGGDHAIYWDCRPEFVQAVRGVLSLHDEFRIRLAAPYLTWDKRQIARHGKTLGVPFERTWTCYEGGETPCGKCGSCNERIEALA